LSFVRRTLVYLALVLACPAFGEPACAQTSRLDDILARGVLRVGTTGDYRPFTALDKASGAYSGFDIDLAQSLGAALGVRVEFERTSWPDLGKDFEAGVFDIAMGGISVTLDRAKKGFFSAPYMREGKTPIARCADQGKYQTIAEIDRPEVTVIANPGGTNERFDRANLHAAKIVVYPDNTTIFDEIAQGKADVMITDASETRFQQKLHANVLCAIHPDKPFDFAEKAYWMPPDAALKAFVDQWLHLSMENGAFDAIYAKWFE
jgi:cyclohexadienyl dehydratase